MTPTTKQATPISEDSPNLFSKVWWLFFNSMRDAVVALQNAGFLKGVGLSDTNRLVKVMTANSVTESSITDDGTTVAFTEDMTSTKGATFTTTVKAATLNGTAGVQFNGLAFQPTSALHVTGRTATLAAQNLRQTISALAAGTYRVSVVISFTPTGAVTLASTLAWTDDIGSTLSQGLGVSAATSPITLQETLTVVVDGTHDLTFAVGTVTGTVTYNVKVVLERIG